MCRGEVWRQFRDATELANGAIQISRGPRFQASFDVLPQIRRDLQSEQQNSEQHHSGSFTSRI